MKNGRSEAAPTVDRMRFARHLEAHSWEPVVEVAQTLTPAASRLSPLVRGTINPIFNKHFVPLTKGDSREAAGGQGLSHFYHGLLAPPLPRRGINFPTSKRTRLASRPR